MRKYLLNDIWLIPTIIIWKCYPIIFCFRKTEIAGLTLISFDLAKMYDQQSLSTYLIQHRNKSIVRILIYHNQLEVTASLISQMHEEAIDLLNPAQSCHNQ